MQSSQASPVFYYPVFYLCIQIIIIFTYNLKQKSMTKGFKELLKLAKAAKVTTYDELQNLVYECSNEITGADFECVRQQLKIRMF